jgi:DNA-binding response OmpR family regulator
MTLEEQLEEAKCEIVLLKGDRELMSAMDVFSLTRTRARIAIAIANSPQISKDAIHHVVYGDRVDHVGNHIIEVHLTHLRKKLKAFGIEIRTLWGVGYSMPPASRIRFKQILEGKVVT